MTIDGHPLVLFRTTTGPGWVIDNWRELSHPIGHDFRTGAVFTGRMSFAEGEHLAPFWRNIYGVAWEVEPDPDPVARFHEALRQGRERAAERMGGDMQSAQVWPPPGARTLLALVNGHDSRAGWARWIWQRGEPVAVQQDGDLLAGRLLPDFEDPTATRAWAHRQGWASVIEAGLGRGSPQRLALPRPPSALVGAAAHCPTAV